MFAFQSNDETRPTAPILLRSKADRALTRGRLTMNSHFAFALVACVSLMGGVAAVEAAPISKALQQACGTDYKKYCGDYGLESAALRSCMNKAGQSLSKICVNALVEAGEVSQTEVDRRKKSGN